MNTQRIDIADFARHRGPWGTTCNEAERALGLLHEAASAACSRLKRAGILVPNGERRLTASGRKAEVLVHRDYAETID